MRKTHDSSKTVWERRAQRPRGREVTTEGLLDDDARAAGAAGLAERLNHAREHARRDREIVKRVLGTAELFAERGVSGDGAVVAADVVEPLRELGEDCLVEGAAILDTLACACAKVIYGPLQPRDSDDGHLEMASPFHRVESGKYLLEDEVAGRPAMRE